MQGYYDLHGKRIDFANKQKFSLENSRLFTPENGKQILYAAHGDALFCKNNVAVCGIRRFLQAVTVFFNGRFSPKIFPIANFLPLCCGDNYFIG
jgi:hypothetical protein